MKIYFVFVISVFINLNIFSDDFDKSFNKIEKSNLNIPFPKKSIEKYSDNNVRVFFENLSNLFGVISQPDEMRFTKSFKSSKVLYNINLSPTKDKYLYTNITFKTTKGSVVYVSITRASNCPGGGEKCKDSEKFLLTMTSNASTQFIKIKDIINLSIFMSGHKKVIIDGDEYIAKIYASVNDINKSKIEIKGPQGIVINKTLGEIMDVFAGFGVGIRILKEYKVVYGRKVECLSQCFFSNDNMVFMVESPIKKDSAYYTIDEKSWNGKNFYFKDIGKNYLFNINNGIFTAIKSESGI
ncbi:MAG: hypothetical protein K6357_02880 [Elusimicrobiota bacterium]